MATSTSECDPYRVTKQIFSMEGIRVVVPDAVADKAIRWLVERGRTVQQAFQEAGQSANTPDPAVIPCAHEVYSVKYYDLESGTWKPTSRGYTCNGLWRCFTEYIGGNRYFPRARNADRRMWINEGLFAPSPNEERCIKQHFLESRSLEAAYKACGAEDIIPEWPTCLPFVAQALVFDPNGYIYTALKTWYRLQYLSGWPPSPYGNGIPTIPPHHHVPVSGEGKLLILGAIAVGVVLFAR